MSILALILIVFIALMICGIPIAVSVGLATIVALLLGGDMSISIVPQKMFVAVNSFTLLAIPFFMLAGAIMEQSGITAKLVKFADSLVGWMRCGMCYVVAVAGMLMAGISGSATADTAALSSIMIDAMDKMGYPKKFSAPLLAASGSVGVIIPPSLTFIILGSITSISVSKLFMAGVIPGVLVGFGLMIASRIICTKYGWGMSITAKFSIKEVWKSFLDSLLPLLAPVIIIGGIVSGIFTPTEASVVAVVYTFILGTLVYKTISPKDFINIASKAAKGTAIVMFVIGTSMVFSWLLTVYNVPKMIGTLLTSVSDSHYFILAIIAVVFFIGGMFIDGTPLIIMLVPVFFPIIQSVGIDPLTFGVVICILSAIGGVSPPVGAALFVACSSGNVRMETTLLYTIPFLIAMLVVVALIIFIPNLTTLIPGLI
ncbi:MAG: TRAP transporter large permease [Oscillospiraceae bacterium]